MSQNFRRHNTEHRSHNVNMNDDGKAKESKIK